MKDFEQLKAAAAKRRDLDQSKVQREYRYAITIIRAFERQLKRTKPIAVPKAVRLAQERRIRCTHADAPYLLMTTIEAAVAVLSEGKPMTHVEIVVEIMARGHRQFDEARSVLKCLRASMAYHADKFTQDGEGRWSVIGA